MKEKITKNLKIILIVLSILVIVIPAILAYGRLTEKVDNLEESTEKIKNLDIRIIELEKIAAGTEVSLSVIQSDISEIKSDLKEIVKDLKINPERI